MYCCSSKMQIFVVSITELREWIKITFLFQVWITDPVYLDKVCELELDGTNGRSERRNGWWNGEEQEGNGMEEWRMDEGQRRTVKMGNEREGMGNISCDGCSHIDYHHKKSYLHTMDSGMALWNSERTGNAFCNIIRWTVMPADNWEELTELLK